MRTWFSTLLSWLSPVGYQSIALHTERRQMFVKDEIRFATKDR